MSEYSVTVIRGSETWNIPARAGSVLLDALRNEDISVHAPCGGHGTCHQCRVTVTGSFAPVGGGETRSFSGAEILACRYRVESDCTVLLPEEKKAIVMTSGVGDIPACGSGLGVAVDIGTTTVASFLYDLPTGRLIAMDSGRNAQRPFGADVISRIQYSDEPGGLEQLSSIIRTQLSGMINTMCAHAGRSRGEITYVSIAGNTVMEHIFAGLSPVTIGVAPFRTLSLFGEEMPASGVFDGLNRAARLYLCPALAGYVGGDITAGLLSSGAAREGELSLFMDIGTNGEMGIGDHNGYLCCATAAGPAFEGAEIEMGMDGSEGAVDRVKYVDGDIQAHVIGDVTARGICGSGLVDALAAMLQAGVLTATGRMIKPQEAPEALRDRLRPAPDGTGRFYLRDEVYISAADVRQLQLAKAAIRAGIETLLSIKGKTSADVCHVLIAGGFGAYMDVSSAGSIGLLPQELVEKTKHVGNSAGAGAALALGEPEREKLREFSDRCRYYELSSSSIFMEKYIECMAFDEAEE